ASGEAVAAGAPVARPDPADAAAGSRVPVREVAPVAQVPAPPAAAGISPLAIDAAELAELLQQEAVQRQSLVEELFGHLAEMPNMTDSLAQWLQELDAPLVQEATENRGFFLEEQHPLRVIVDQLAHLQSFRPTPDADPRTDTLRQRVTQLLEPVRRGEADDAVLQAIADQVGALTLEQSRLYQRRVERVSEASAGRDRVRRARLAVAEELDRRYAGKQVPEVVAELIDVGWRAALELAWLNGAEQEQRYARHLAVLDAAVTALGGEAHDPAAPVIAPQALFDAIASELGSTAFDPFRRTALENRLRAELFDPEARPNLVEMPAQARAAGADRPEPPEGVNRHTWQRLLDRCMAVAVGDRVRLLDAPEGRQALRVAWIRDDHTQFVLVDHQGLMARDIELPELALGLHRRRILLEQVDGRPASDRAVEAMLHRMEGRLVYQEAHDSLTGLINRRQFTTALEQALGVADGGAGVLVWIDVDQFRLVNDIHGYDTGDRLLIALARQLDKARGAKVAGHLGGDRFGVLLPELTGVDGERWVEELRRAVAAMPFDWKGPPMALSLSVGIVDLSGDRGGVGSVLRAAESAITAAKATGGGQVYVYREDDPEIAREQSAVQWVVQVDEALDRGRLQLRCQPIVPIRPDRALQPHYEVLLGVANGAGELLPIAQFIEAAERYNRMRAVDRWIARTVIEQIASGRELLPMLHGFAINLSGQTANDPGFVAFIRELFERHAIDPSWVSFEITETAAIADLSNAAGIVRDLKALGCKVALDDFGSGSASYSYLKELPVDWLKIDGVFVRKVAESMEDLAVVRSINEIGHFLGKQTIAEYVADNTILRRVREIGVDFGQGYAIAPPLQLDELFQQASTGAA
ncbi:MAG: DUF1631 family protein, partial [Gammaproteobacteria bacterium]|nr:DUF1631 family protein [Gammaproteobacteria bacterium]